MAAASPAVSDPFAPPLTRREWKRLRRAQRPGFWSRDGGHPLRGWRLPVMILGFIAWWPIGLALLTLFLVWRPDMSCSPAWMTPWKDRVRDAMPRASSGNVAFDEHRAAVLKRLEEERRALDAQQQEFAAFMAQLRRAKDQEEFDRFMAGRDPRVG